MLTCTHLVLYVKNLPATHDFYIGVLGCTLRRYAPEEGFLSVAVGDFIVNFYVPKPARQLSAGYYQGVGHLGLEAPTRSVVEACFTDLQLSGYRLLSSTTQPLETLTDLRAQQTPGPYRFYVYDPDGYTVEIHTWEGVDGGVSSP